MKDPWGGNDWRGVQEDRVVGTKADGMKEHWALKKQ